MTRNRARALSMLGSTATALLAFAAVVSPRYELVWGPLQVSAGAAGTRWCPGAARNIPMQLLTSRPDLYDCMRPVCWWPVAQMDWGVREVAVPLWMPLAVVALPTAFSLWTAHRLGRRGCCGACGYDLKGAPSLTCPECGTEHAP